MHPALPEPRRPTPRPPGAVRGPVAQRRHAVAALGASARRPACRRFAGIALAAAAYVALPAAGYSWRADIVRLVPGTARLYAAVGLPVNLRGLVLDDVRSVEAIERGEPVLVVSGTITNTSPEAIDVPRLRLAVRGAEATEIYAWTARVPEGRLAPGQSTGFRARLAAPPEAGRSVAVRFEDPPTTRLGLR